MYFAIFLDLLFLCLFATISLVLILSPFAVEPECDLKKKTDKPLNIFAVRDVTSLWLLSDLH